MVFITSGSAAAPAPARRRSWPRSPKVRCPTIGVVTKPFTFEGRAQADRRAREPALKAKVDTLITIPNDRLRDVVQKNTSILDAFRVVDDVLRQGVQGISDIITIPGLINLDFADVRAIMKDAGSALMGIGRASGENRAVEAARQAIASPLLEVNISGAQGILFNITGSSNLSLFEVTEAAEEIRAAADPEANIIFGTSFNERLGDEVMITVIATGFDGGRRPESVRAAATGPPPRHRAGHHAAPRCHPAPELARLPRGARAPAHGVVRAPVGARCRRRPSRATRALRRRGTAGAARPRRTTPTTSRSRASSAAATRRWW